MPNEVIYYLRLSAFICGYIFVFVCGFAYSEECIENQLLKDLCIVEEIDKQINDRLPITRNHLLQGGYINMPSARMSPVGTMAFGYSYVPPYRIYGLLGQLTDRIEVTGDYRIFIGVDDPILSPLGFGDLSDKGINVKFALFHPEDSNYRLPGIAFGFDDILGTRHFRAQYLVFTQVFLNADLEISVGVGAHRIRKWFGGLCWIPWRKSSYTWLQGLKFAAEYDATPYHSERIEKHPKGRESRSPINVGLKYNLWDYFDFSVSYIRGLKWAYSASINYNLGETTGFLPKIDDALIYTAPVNTEPLGALRPENTMAQELYFAFKEQGLNMHECTLTYNDCAQKVLRLRVTNYTYRVEWCLKERLSYLLSALIPSNIDVVIVMMDTDRFPYQEYAFNMDTVRLFADGEICLEELLLLTRTEEASFPDPYTERLLLKSTPDLWNIDLFPRTQTFFGSSKGKFKYSLGLNLGLNGYLPSDVYYSIQVGYPFFSDIRHCSDFDRLNPSQLLNVRSDIIRYLKHEGLVLDQAYIQKSWTLGNGWYSRLAAGYFEIEYGGIATEFLYYPVKSNWAVGIEGATFLKRAYTGMGFTTKIRKFDGFKPTYRHHFIGSQYFLKGYYDWRSADISFKVSVGKFLANDYGARFEVSRYFPSGLIISLWTSYTNGRDTVNDHSYHDMGIGFSMPIDIFYTESSRDRWGYAMSAWLRDVGVTASTGLPLYDSIRDLRQ